MSAGVKSIILRKMRGATAETCLTLDPGRRLTLVFGENGTGKSTLMDALEMVAHRRCGTLDERGSATVREHLPAIGCEPKSVRAEVVVDEQSWVARMHGGRITVDGPELGPNIHVLRRQHLAQLVEARPAERYEALKGLIDVTGVERGESSLTSALNSAEHLLETELTRQTEAEQALRSLWESAGEPGPNHRDWAEAVANADLADANVEVDRLARIVSALDASERACSAADEARRDWRTAEAALAAVRHAVSEASRLDETDAVALVELLQRARDYIGETDPASCPVCTQPIVGKELVGVIAGRLVQLNDWCDLAERVRNAEQAVTSAAACVTRSSHELIAAVRALVAGWLTASPALSDLADVVASDAPHAPDGGAPPTDDDLRSAVRFMKSVGVHRLELEGRLGRARDAVALRDAVDRQLRRLLAAEQNLTSQALLVERLRAIRDVIHRQRKAFVQRMLDRVAGETARMYERVHPGEHTSIQSLELDPKRRASLLQTASFHGHGQVAPQGYLSDAHMDTLGLCLWLAVVKETGGPEAVVALDDVVTSLDDAHLGRLMDLIAEESRHFAQVIVTTHHGLWRDQLVRQAASGASVNIVELQPWTIERGVQTRPVVPSGMPER